MTPMHVVLFASGIFSGASAWYVKEATGSFDLGLAALFALLVVVMTGWNITVSIWSRP